MASKLAEKAGTLHITIEQGATFSPVFTWKDENGTLINLIGYTARMQIRENLEDTAFIHEATTENGGITLGDAAGTITLNITATDTAAFTFDTAVYDLELISGANVTRLLKGDVTLSLEVTR